MKTAKKDRFSVRSEELIIKMSANEKNTVMDVADRAGLTMSAWVRMIIAEKINQK